LIKLIHSIKFYDTYSELLYFRLKFLRLSLFFTCYAIIISLQLAFINCHLRLPSSKTFDEMCKTSLFTMTYKIHNCHIHIELALTQFSRLCKSFKTQSKLNSYFLPHKLISARNSNFMYQRNSIERHTLCRFPTGKT
jgi:hypothetical protein